MESVLGRTWATSTSVNGKATKRTDKAPWVTLLRARTKERGKTILRVSTLQLQNKIWNFESPRETDPSLNSSDRPQRLYFHIDIIIWFHWCCVQLLSEFSTGGVGTFTDPYGNVYEGEWLNGKKDGRGALKYKNGDVYEGSFKEDLFDGLGILTMTNGMRYEGNWQRGQFHGKGTLVHPSGKKYDGQWQYGLKHGSGTLIRVNGDNYVGEWANNKVGHNIYYQYILIPRNLNIWAFLNPDLTAFFLQRHGQGTLDQTNSDGTIYSGTFFEGKYDGNGTVKYRDGSKYEGLWRTGERHGKGTFYFYGSSSLKYTGEWARDVKNGQVSVILMCYS